MHYEFIGWCHDTEANADKVWGVMILQRDINGDQYSWDSQHKFAAFWGRRGKKLQTKISTDNQDAINKLINSKSKKGYTAIRRDELDLVYPEFQADLEETAFWAQLKA